jgi:hypothetical protein
MLHPFKLINLVLFFPKALPIAGRLRNDKNVYFGKESIAQGFSPG